MDRKIPVLILKIPLYLICILVVVLFIILSFKTCTQESKTINNYNTTIIIKDTTIVSLDLNIENVKEALINKGIQFPDIVLAQAILETGYFKSKVCKEYNNLFGLYDSRSKDYYKFNHWTESIEGYKKYVEYKYKPPDCYYKFLEELPYAMDPNYINKIKQIVKRHEDISIRRYSWT